MSRKFSPTERAELVLLYTKFDRNYALTSRAWRLRKGYSAPFPTSNNLKAMEGKLIEDGTLADRPRSGRPSVCGEEQVDAVRLAIEENPSSSVRRISQSVEMSATTNTEDAD
jgi:hypothetical protein